MSSRALCAFAVWLLPRLLAAEALFQSVEVETIELPQIPFALRVADLDGDGRGDAALVHGDSASVSVLLRDANGDLAVAAVHDVGLSPLAVRAGDLNGDARLDLVVCNLGSSAIGVLLNQGAGAFAPMVEAAPVREPRAVELRDFNQDGVLDFVASSDWGGERGALALMLGDGRGGFAKPRSFDVGDDPHAIAVDDFDGDGAADAAVAQSGSIAWLAGRPGQGFAAAVRTAIDDNPRFITAGDFNRDGLADLAVIIDAGRLGTLKSSGDGTFRLDYVASLTSANGRSLAAPLVLDVGGDGQLDILAQAERAGDSALALFPGAGDGSFAHAEDLPLGDEAADFAAADVDGDADLDFLAASRARKQLTVFHGPERGRLTEGLSIPLSGKPSRLVLAAAPDGGARLVAASVAGLHVLGRLDAGGVGVLRERPVDGVIVELVAADFDGAPGDELALVDLSGSRLLFFKLESSGEVQLLREHSAGGAPGRAASADFDGDGRQDLAVADKSTSSVTVILHPTSDSSRVEQVTLGAPPGVSLAADGNLDGNPDLAIATRLGLRLFWGNGAGGFATGPVLVDLSDVVDLAAGDLDNDGRDDLVVAKSTGIALRYGPLDGGAVRRETLNAGDDILRVLIVDADSDGRLDIASLSSRPAPRVLVNLGLAGGGFAAAEGSLTGLGPRLLAVTDLDGDGRLDAATGSLFTAEIRVLWGRQGGAPMPSFRRGDADDNGTVQITDAIAVLQRLFAGGATLACDDAADADDGGTLDLTDAVAVLGYLFRGAAAPPAPGPTSCGPDPTGDDLTCDRSTCP